MSEIVLKQEFAVANSLGEGATWDTDRQAFWWTDIEQNALFRYRIDRQQPERFSVPERIGCFAPVAGAEELIVAAEHGIGFVTLPDGALQTFARPEANLPGNRMNDGRCDRAGRFWFGSITEAADAPAQAALYSMDASLQWQQQLTSLRISNGVCFSPDGNVLYHTDTPSGRIDQYDINAQTGNLENGRLFAECPAGGSPDGATVDAEGFVYSAQWGGRCILRFAPDGRLDAKLPVPVSQPTCVAFGGPDLSWLLVTSARQGLAADELAEDAAAGNAFIFETPWQGLPETAFQRDAAASV